MNNTETRGSDVRVTEAIREAEAVLPGECVDNGLDPRWQAIVKIGEYIEPEPEAVWEFIRRWGRHPQKDLRDAVATCLLEHLLEYHFAAYIHRVEELAMAEPRFGETFLTCWQLGEAGEPDNAERFDSLKARLRRRARDHDIPGD